VTAHNNPNFEHVGEFSNKIEIARKPLATARYTYKAKNGKLLVVLTSSQKEKLIFKQYTQTLFNKDLF
jgi:hypothetical protein